MARRSLKSAAYQVWVRVVATIGLAAAILTTWWMKVEDARAPKAPSAVAFGQPVKVGRSIFTPQKLILDSGDGQGDRRLILTGLLENATRSSQQAFFGFPDQPVVLTSGGATFEAPRVNLGRDGRLLVQLEPRIREAVDIVWKVPPGWQEQDVTISFSAQRFKLKDNLYAKSSWLGFYPTGTLTVRPEQGT